MVQAAVQALSVLVLHQTELLIQAVVEVALLVDTVSMGPQVETVAQVS